MFTNNPTFSKKLDTLCHFSAWFQSYGLLVLVSLAILIGLLAPLNLLAIQPFHHDEALYATWALKVISGADSWLARTPIDKPPLFLYVLAGALHLLGASETAARLPSLLATGATVLLTFLLGRKLYGNSVAVLAVWLAALSPFVLLFAPTAFTDPLLMALVMAGCLAAAYSQPVPAAICLALATATKQQGLFFTPLAIGLLLFSLKPSTPQNPASQNSSTDNPIPIIQPSPRPSHANLYFPTSANYLFYLPFQKPALTFYPQGVFRSALRFTLYVLRFMFYFCLTLLPFLIWDLSRSRPSAFFQESLKNYGGLTTDIGGFAERWLGFIHLLSYGTASTRLNLIFLLGCPALLLYGLWLKWRDWRLEIGDWRLGISNWQHTHEAGVDWLLAGFNFFFLLLHTFLSFQIWDRYLLGLMPLLALLLARVLLLPWRIVQAYLPAGKIGPPIHSAGASSEPQPNSSGQAVDRGPRKEFSCLATRHEFVVTLLRVGYGGGLVFLLIFSLVGPVQDAANGRYPLGSHSQALQGIEQIVAYLQGHAGANHTLYHHWLGSHWRFYLWGYPYDLQYWATPEELAAKAQPGHFIAYPAWRSETEVRLALFKAGLGLRELARAYRLDGGPSIFLYRIETLE